jgi:hypothetical protein
LRLTAATRPGSKDGRIASSSVLIGLTRRSAGSAPPKSSASRAEMNE